MKNRRQTIKDMLTYTLSFGIVTLVPSEARAKGSWTNNQNDRPIPIPNANQNEQRYVVPFSNAWRHKNKFQ